MKERRARRGTSGGRPDVTRDAPNHASARPGWRPRGGARHPGARPRTARGTDPGREGGDVSFATTGEGGGRASSLALSIRPGNRLTADVRKASGDG